jgi:hypothetical protein
VIFFHFFESFVPLLSPRDADFFFFFFFFFSNTKQQALEMHKKSPEKLRGWCIYWLVLATFTVFERITDAFLFFLPLYHEAKVAFVVYLWHPKSQGALYIYDKFVAPTLSKHEELIDRKIEETQAKDDASVVAEFTDGASGDAGAATTSGRGGSERERTGQSNQKGTRGD